jgi:subtilisin family serine protease
MKRFSLMLAVAAAMAAGSAQAATYVVQARALDFDAALARQVEAQGGQVVARYPQIGVAIVRSDAGFPQRARRVRALQSVTEDRVLQFGLPETVPAADLAEAAANPPESGDDDPYFDLQWGHDAIDAPEAWERTGERGAGVRVAVLDSGIDCDHPDLVPNLNLALSTSFVAGEPVCELPAGFNHGTHVAGTVAAADNAFGTIGVAPEAEIVAVKVLSAYTGSGSFEGIIGGIVHAADIDADLINMSLGVRGGLPVTPETHSLIGAVQRAVTYARQQGTTVIASSGNDGIDFDNATDGSGNRLMAFPGGLHEVIGVSATAPEGWGLSPMTDLDPTSHYSSYGKVVVNFAAPGGDWDYPGDEICEVAGLVQLCYVFDYVFSTSNNGWSWASGTSMAAPHVTGVAALIIGANGGDMSPSAVQSALTHGAEDKGARGIDPFYGRGRVNADRSL